MNKLIFIFALLVIVGCQEKKLSQEQMKGIVHEQNERLEALFKEGDPEKIAAFYDADAKLSAEDANEVFVGREAIKNFWKTELVGSKLIDMETNTVTVDGAGDVIYETGIVKLKIQLPDTVVETSSKFVNVWKKQDDGSYLLDVDSWNTIKH